MNGVNIHLFQFERDLTWMAFFMDAHDRFYARYGGREDADPDSHLSKNSLIRTMNEVLKLHRAKKVQTSRYEPGPEPIRKPADIPAMEALMKPRKDSQCIHCHDVKVAELRQFQREGRFDRSLLFTYPAPSGIGIVLDTDVQNLIREVRPGSLAERSGLQAGDTILSVDGQRILTFADLTRVLELTAPNTALPLELRRGRQDISARLQLSGFWRRTEDPSWRESLHVAGPNGGFWGRKLKAEERSPLGLAEDKLAVLVTFIWGDYTRRAGLQQNDVVVNFDGLERDMTIPQLHAHLNLNRNYGDKIPMRVRRGGAEHVLALDLPAQPEGE